MTNKKNKKWVYDSLIESADKESVGYLAYCIYKKQKNALAYKYASESLDEEKIQTKLKDFHENTLTDEAIKQYLDLGLNYFEELTKEIESKVIAAMTPEVEALQKEHKNQLNSKIRENKELSDKIELLKKRIKKKKRLFLAEASGELAEQIMLNPKTKPNKRTKFFNWLLSGFASITATLLVMVTIYGFTAWTLPQKDKDLLLSSFIERAATFLISSPNFSKPDSSNNQTDGKFSQKDNKDNSKTKL